MNLSLSSINVILRMSLYCIILVWCKYGASYGASYGACMVGFFSDNVLGIDAQMQLLND